MRLTNRPADTKGWLGQAAYIDAAHRVQARVEHVITGNDSGLGHFPSFISSPDLGVFAATAGVFCVLFAACGMRYLNTVSAADPEQIPLSLLFLELSGYYVNAVQQHVYAADVVVSHGVDGDGFR